MSDALMLALCYLTFQLGRLIYNVVAYRKETGRWW